MGPMTDDDARRLRMRGQRLEPRASGGACDVVRAVCGIQAQDPAAARLSVRVRSTGLTQADVDAEPGLVRTWAWRGTLHLLAAEDVPWILSLVAGPRIRGAGARWRQLGLDEPLYARARDVLAAAVAEAPRTRAELRAALAAEGIDATGQRLPHLVARAAVEGVLVAGLDDTYRAPGNAPPPPRDEALAELARRYLDAYGPAEPRDLAAWSGLPAADVRAAWATLEGRLEEVAVRGRAAWMLAGTAAPPPPPEPVVRLLPAFDTALLGHRDRDLIVDHEHARRVWPGGGWLHPVLVVDGRAAGTWRATRGAVTVEPFAPLPPRAQEALEAEIEDVARFSGGGA
jgi:Winged helix DNA-binding domain